MENRLNILFPVEALHRELDYRLMLACLCAKTSNRIFIGHQHAIYRLSQYVQGGLYVGRNLFDGDGLRSDTDLSKYQAIKKRHFLLIHLDEEGAIFAGDQKSVERTLLRKLNPNYLKAEDYVCAWGDFQTAFFQSLKPNCAGHIFTTGHPRFDLCKMPWRQYFSEEVQRIKDQYGDFVLINTNMSLANNGLGIADTFSERLRFDARDPVSRMNHFSEWVHASESFLHLIKLANQLSIHFPKTPIVIRPHPSEDHSFYRTVFKKISNIHVVYQGSVGPWLLACRVLIHQGCTTAVEASLLGKKVITYQAVTDERFDMRIPNSFGMRCTTEEEVIEKVKAILSSPESASPAQAREDVEPFIYNFKGDSFSRVLEVLNRAESDLQPVPKSTDLPSFMAAEFPRKVVKAIKDVARPFFSERKKRNRYSLNKWASQGLREASIGQKILKIQGLLKKSIHYKILTDEMMVLETRGPH